MTTSPSGRPANTRNMRMSLHLRRTLSSKIKGQWVESLFQCQIIALGFSACKPWGDCSAFDFMLECLRHTLRVQVKSAWKHSPWRKNGYVFRTQRGSGIGSAKSPYTARDVDFFVGLVVPADAWYIIPVSAVGRRTCIYVYPDRRFNKGPAGPDYEQFRDAWHLLLSQRR
jgi:hypothetical protein